MAGRTEADGAAYAAFCAMISAAGATLNLAGDSTMVAEPGSLYKSAR